MNLAVMINCIADNSSIKIEINKMDNYVSNVSSLEYNIICLHDIKTSKGSALLTNYGFVHFQLYPLAHAWETE